MNKISCLFLCLLAAPTLLNACGFQPVYGKHGAAASATGKTAETHLALTEIEIIPDREGQILRNALMDSFYRTGNPANPEYTLIVTPIQEQVVKLDITKTADSTRGQLRLSTQIKLINKQTGETLFQKAVLSTTSYNILASEFATRVSESSTRENAIKDLARQIETKLALYFSSL
jgi:LPS-assembly lipoprotein